MPGQENIRLAKKGGALSLPEAGFRRFRPAIPFPPRLFAEKKRGGLKRFLPALFGFGACFLARRRHNRLERPTNLKVSIVFFLTLTLTLTLFKGAGNVAVN
jgi:hypothetical protein